MGVHPPADGVGEDTTAKQFYFLSADFVREYPGRTLPFFQEIRAEHPAAIEKKMLSWAEVVKGVHVETCLSVSHRWMDADQPDPDGAQLAAIKQFLSSFQGEKIKRVWIDAQCMPQDVPHGSRTAADAAEFQVMLKSINMLYLGTQVLILLDLSYVSRFWTQFEAWLSMQLAMPGGLESAVGTPSARNHIVPIQNAAEQSTTFKAVLTKQWASKSPEEAHDFLAKPDVTVTNQSDKDQQLPKIKRLNKQVARAFKGVAQQQQSQLAAAEAALALAEARAASVVVKAEATAEEAQTAAVEAAQQRAEAVRSELATFERALRQHVMPVVMEREAAVERAALGTSPTADETPVNKDCCYYCCCCCCCSSPTKSSKTLAAPSNEEMARTKISQVAPTWESEKSKVIRSDEVAATYARLSEFQKLVVGCNKGKEFSLVSASDSRKCVVVNRLGVAKGGPHPGGGNTRFVAVDVGGGMVALKNEHTATHKNGEPTARWLGVDVFGTTNGLLFGPFEPEKPLFKHCMFKVVDAGHGKVKFICPVVGNKVVMKSLGGVFHVVWCELLSGASSTGGSDR